ncbi:hypothetical protein KR018_011669, partial [Drosophila ironensis]
SDGKGNCVVCAAVAETACQRCGDFYCSKYCQKLDWPRHRYICFPMPALVHPKSFSIHQAPEEFPLEAAGFQGPDKAAAGPIPISNISINAVVPVDFEGYKATGVAGAVSLNPNISTNAEVVGMPPSNSLVYVTGFRSANRCNIRIASKTADIAYKQMCLKVNAFANEMPPMKITENYEYCLAGYNGSFERAQVIYLYGSQNVKVLLIDRGTFKIRSVTDIRPISPELQALPCYSKVVQLKDVANYPINDDFIKFAAQFETDKFLAIYQKKIISGLLSLELIHPETRKSINDLINEFYGRSHLKISRPYGSANEKDNPKAVAESVTAITTTMLEQMSQKPPKVIVKLPTEVLTEAPNNQNEAGKTEKEDLNLIPNESGALNDTKPKKELAGPEETHSSQSDGGNILKCSNPNRADETNVSNPSGKEENARSNQKMISKIQINGSKENEKDSENIPPQTSRSKDEQWTGFFSSLKSYDTSQPFELRRLCGSGIDVFVVDSSKICRGMFGAFDSSYAHDFSDVYVRLENITDEEPYSPIAKEYVIAKFEGSWYRARVEQIRYYPNKPTEYRVLYVDYTNAKDVIDKDIRRYPQDLTTACVTSLCAIEGFPHRPNMQQLAFLSETFKVHQLIHIDSVYYLNNVAIVKSHSIIEKLNKL